MSLRSRVPKHAVWLIDNYETKTVEENGEKKKKVECKICRNAGCKQLYSCVTTNMVKHLESQHPELYKAMLEKQMMMKNEGYRIVEAAKNGLSMTTCTTSELPIPADAELEQELFVAVMNQNNGSSFVPKPSTSGLSNSAVFQTQMYIKDTDGNDIEVERVLQQPFDATNVTETPNIVVSNEFITEETSNSNRLAPKRQASLPLESLRSIEIPRPVGVTPPIKRPKIEDLNSNQIIATSGNSISGADGIERHLEKLLEKMEKKDKEIEKLKEENHYLDKKNQSLELKCQGFDKLQMEHQVLNEKYKEMKTEMQVVISRYM